MQLTEFAMMLVVGVGLYLLGLNLINAYFRRKEKFVEQLQQRLKGDQNGTCK
jgi:hypothetical protein